MMLTDFPPTPKRLGKVDCQIYKEEGPVPRFSYWQSAAIHCYCHCPRKTPHLHPPSPTLVPRRVFSLIFYFVFPNCDHSRKLFLSTGHDVNKWAFVLIFVPTEKHTLNPLAYLHIALHTYMYVCRFFVFISFGP